MMRSTQPFDKRARRPGLTNRRGFTLTEMLVVIGIIVLVLGITTPMITRAWRAGDRTRMAADLAAIGAALDAYRQDHGMYPPVPAVLWPTGSGPAAPTDQRGARVLCRALIGPGPATSTIAADVPDGKGGDVPTDPAPGFRTRGTQGMVYGPYITADKFKMVDPFLPPITAARPQPGFWALTDRYNKPILYYPATGKPNIRLANGYIGNRTIPAHKPMYNFDDNTGAMTLAQMAPMMGDTNANGMIDPGETPAHEGPYVLWQAGPDELFGPDATLMAGTDPDKVRKAVQKSDDVTNFR